MSGIWTGRRVLISMLSFFGIIFVVNGIFVYMAMTTWTGLSTENAYKKGIKYNETLEAARRQDSLGWQSKIMFAKNSNSLVVQFKSRGGAPVAGLNIVGTAVRPTHEGYDQEMTFVESGRGAYTARVRFPLNGNWRIELVAKSPNGNIFRAKHTLMVAP
jgi:nitrogen fixation protein FixH